MFVKRLVVKNTIEERMLRLQDFKKGVCNIMYLIQSFLKTMRTSFQDWPMRL